MDQLTLLLSWRWSVIWPNRHVWQGKTTSTSFLWLSQMESLMTCKRLLIRLFVDPPSRWASSLWELEAMTSKAWTSLMLMKFHCILWNTRRIWSPILSSSYHSESTRAIHNNLQERYLMRSLGNWWTIWGKTISLLCHRLRKADARCNNSSPCKGLLEAVESKGISMTSSQDARNNSSRNRLKWAWT